MSFLNSVAVGVVKGSIRTGGMIARGAVRVGYSLGEAGQVGFETASVEIDRQQVLMTACVAECDKQLEVSKARFAQYQLMKAQVAQQAVAMAATA